ncbi:Thiosulfate sulfurtransferase GlpE [subsurface metagenome]
MFRGLLISFIGHTVIIISLAGVSFSFDKPEIQRFVVYRVKTISPQQIADQLKRTEIVDQPDRKIVRIKTPQKPLPENNRMNYQIKEGITGKVQTSELELFEFDISMATSVNKWDVGNDISCGTAPVVFAPANEFGVFDLAIDIYPIRINESYENVIVQEVYTLIKDNEDNDNFIILDFRTPQEYAGGHLENAINIDCLSTSFQDSLATLDKDKIYLIYCRTGKRSSGALQIMNTMDFRKVYDMVDGFEAWAKKNYQLSNI